MQRRAGHGRPAPPRARRAAWSRSTALPSAGANEVQPGLDDPSPVGDAVLLCRQRPPVADGARRARGARTRRCAAGTGRCRGPLVAALSVMVTSPSCRCRLRRGFAVALRDDRPDGSGAPPAVRSDAAHARVCSSRRWAGAVSARPARRVRRWCAGPAGSTGSWPSSTPTRTASWTSRTPLELPSRPILSAQCTDKRVNEVTPALFAATRPRPTTPAADRAELEELIRPTGFFRNKTTSLIGLGAALVERYDGEVPGRLDRPGHAAGHRPQDGQRRARQRLRRARASPSTPTSAGWSRRFGWTEPERPGARSSTTSAALFPKTRVDDASPPADLPRPAGLPRPQAGLRRVRASPRCARRTARARPTRAAAAKLVKAAAAGRGDAVRPAQWPRGRRRGAAGARRARVRLRPAATPAAAGRPATSPTPDRAQLRRAGRPSTPARPGTGHGEPARPDAALPWRGPDGRPGPACAGPPRRQRVGVWCAPCREEVPVPARPARAGGRPADRARRAHRGPRAATARVRRRDAGMRYPPRSTTRQVLAPVPGRRGAAGHAVRRRVGRDVAHRRSGRLTVVDALARWTCDAPRGACWREPGRDRRARLAPPAVRGAADGARRGPQPRFRAAERASTESAVLVLLRRGAGRARTCCSSSGAAPAQPRRPAGLPRRRGRPGRRRAGAGRAARGGGGGRAGPRQRARCWPSCPRCGCRRRASWCTRCSPGGATPSDVRSGRDRPRSPRWPGCRWRSWPTRRTGTGAPPSGWVGPAFEVRGMLVWGFTAGLLDRLLALGGWERPWDTDRLLDPARARSAARAAARVSGTPTQPESRVTGDLLDLVLVVARGPVRHQRLPAGLRRRRAVVRRLPRRRRARRARSRPTLADAIEPGWQPGASFGAARGLRSRRASASCVATAVGVAVRRRLTWHPARLVDACRRRRGQRRAVLLVAWLVGTALAAQRACRRLSQQVRHSVDPDAVDDVMPDAARHLFCVVPAAARPARVPPGLRRARPGADRPGVEPPDPAVAEQPGGQVARPRIVQDPRGRAVLLPAARGQRVRLRPRAGDDQRPRRRRRPRADGAGRRRATYDARVVLYDPEPDVAVLVRAGAAPYAAAVRRRRRRPGDSAVVAGYPENGPFQRRSPPGSASVQEARGPDIYQRSQVTREIYSIYAQGAAGQLRWAAARPERHGVRRGVRGRGRRPQHRLRADRQARSRPTRRPAAARPRPCPPAPATDVRLARLTRPCHGDMVVS